MVEKSIRHRICYAIHQYANANKKYMRKLYRNKETSYFKYWDVNNLYRWFMFSVNGFYGWLLFPVYCIK